MSHQHDQMAPGARRFYYERLRAMPGAQKVRLMSAMHEEARRIARASIRNHNPDLTEEQVELKARDRYRTWSR